MATDSADGACAATARFAASAALLVGGTDVNPADLFRDFPETIMLAAGDAVFYEGDDGDVMYVVVDGTVEILIGGVVVETTERGALLGEMALIDNTPRSATAIAKTACRLVSIDRQRFHSLVQQTPDFSTHVMKVLAERLRRMDSIFAAGVGKK